MSDAKTIFDAMIKRFDQEAAGDMDAVFQFELDDAEDHYVMVSNGECQLNLGEHDDAAVTLSMDTETLAAVMSGELDGMQAFMQGKIRADGDIMLATKLTEIFPS